MQLGGLRPDGIAIVRHDAEQLDIEDGWSLVSNPDEAVDSEGPVWEQGASIEDADPCPDEACSGLQIAGGVLEDFDFHDLVGGGGVSFIENVPPVVGEVEGFEPLGGVAGGSEVGVCLEEHGEHDGGVVGSSAFDHDSGAGVYRREGRPLIDNDVAVVAVEEVAKPSGSVGASVDVEVVGEDGNGGSEDVDGALHVEGVGSAEVFIDASLGELEGEFCVEGVDVCVPQAG